MIDAFEEHGEIAALWGSARYPQKSVVCFDRHLDLKPLSDLNRELLISRAGSESIATLNRVLPVRQAPGAFGLDDLWSAAACVGEVEHLV